MSFNAKPRVLEDIWLPCPQFEALSLELIESWQGSLYGFLESHFGVHMLYAKENLRAVLPTAATVEFLEIEPTTPVLDIFRVAYTFSNKPVEVRQAQYLTTDYHYSNQLN
jgi:GntR family transcriptional regulator